MSEDMLHPDLPEPEHECECEEVDKTRIWFAACDFLLAGVWTTFLGVDKTPRSLVIDVVMIVMLVLLGILNVQRATES